MLVKGGKDPRAIFEAINKHFTNSSCSAKAKAMMLNAFSKLAIKYDTLKDEVQMLCHMCSEHWNADVQQRGVEFLALFNQDINLQAKVVSLNPVFTEEQQASNPLLKKFAKKSKRIGKAEEIAKQSTSSSSTNQSQPQAKNFQTMAGNNNMTSHPLANNPFFKAAIDRLCPNLVNLLDAPGKL